MIQWRYLKKPGNRKLPPFGKVYFFEPRTRGFNEKIELMNLLDVQPEDCGLNRPEKTDPEKTEKYMLFYERAINRICELMAENKGQ